MSWDGHASQARTQVADTAVPEHPAICGPVGFVSDDVLTVFFREKSSFQDLYSEISDISMKLYRVINDIYIQLYMAYK